MPRNKCVCDVCGKVIYKDPTDGISSRVIKYWNAQSGVIENNRIVKNEDFDLCSVECCMVFADSQEDKLRNPFTDYYFEIVPIKVFGEPGEI